MYSDTLTWQDYFEQNAVESLKQNKALMAEAKAAGFTYDTTDEYNTFKETIKTSAASAGISEKEYVRSIYGSYATMGRIEEYVKNDMVQNASTHLFYFRQPAGFQEKSPFSPSQEPEKTAKKCHSCATEGRKELV